MTEQLDIIATLEALIFVSKEPLTLERMIETLNTAGIEVESSVVKHTIKELMARWADPERRHGRGLVLQKVAGGYAFLTAQEQSFVAQKVAFTKPVEITKSQLEVLSIVAYRQPITRVDIDEIRGVDSANGIKRLMQLKLLKILGKSEGLGRPLLYGTTRQFLEFFSLNSLNDLPTLKQFSSLGALEEDENIDVESERVSLKDLFQDNKNSSLFSHDVQRLSDEALKSLDEAMLRIESVEKTPNK